MNEIKTWQERQEPIEQWYCTMNCGPSLGDIRFKKNHKDCGDCGREVVMTPDAITARDLEIADLRAALAKQVPAQEQDKLKDKLLAAVNKLQTYDESNGEGGGVSEWLYGSLVRISHVRNAIKRVLKNAQLAQSADKAKGDHG